MTTIYKSCVYFTYELNPKERFEKESFHFLYEMNINYMHSLHSFFDFLGIYFPRTFLVLNFIGHSLYNFYIFYLFLNMIHIIFIFILFILSVIFYFMFIEVHEIFYFFSCYSNESRKYYMPFDVMIIETEDNLCVRFRIDKNMESKHRYVLMLNTHILNQDNNGNFSTFKKSLFPNAIEKCTCVIINSLLNNFDYNKKCQTIYYNFKVIFTLPGLSDAMISLSLLECMYDYINNHGNDDIQYILFIIHYNLSKNIIVMNDKRILSICEMQPKLKKNLLLNIIFCAAKNRTPLKISPDPIYYFTRNELLIIYIMLNNIISIKSLLNK